MSTLTLRSIPEILYREFSMFDSPQQSLTTEETQGKRHTCMCASQHAGPRGLLALTHENYICDMRKRHSSSFRVYPYAFKIERLGCGNIGMPPPTPLLEIEFYTNDPPHDKKDSPWVFTKGYWVDEFLTVHYGHNRLSPIVDSAEDWMFGYLLRIQARAYALGREVSVRGHWQHEWNPEGNYSKRWTPH